MCLCRVLVQRDNVDQSALVLMNDGPTNQIRLARIARQNGLIDASFNMIDRCSNSAMRTEDAFNKLRELIMVRAGLLRCQWFFCAKWEKNCVSLAGVPVPVL